MFKVVTLLKRRSGLGVEEFQQRWRERLAPFAAETLKPERYVISLALLQGYRKGELLFDGISEMWFPSEVKTTEDDEIFDRMRTVVMPVDVHVIKDGAIPPNAVKNIEFVNRRPGMTLAPFQAYWRDVHGPIASKIPVLRRYEQNHLKASIYAAESDPPYDGLAVTWFESTADMKRGTTTPEYVATRADEANFLPDGHLPIIITREHVIVG
jgi:uncharacterized protein (TIGR02118 family)